MKIKAEIINRSTLTAQEAVVLRHLCEGKMRKEIAASMFRSYGCVSKHIDSIAEKLGAHSAAEIVAFAVANGMVDIQFDHSRSATALLRCLMFMFLIAPQTNDLRQPPRNGRPLPQTTRIKTQSIGGRSWT